MQSPAPSPRIPVFRRTRTVEERHTDALGHVNNVVWVRWVAALSEAHSQALGVDYEAVVRIGGLWVVRNHDVTYLRSALPGEQIVEETWVSQARGARCVRHVRFRDAAGEPYVVARSLWAWVDADTQRPRRMPPEVLARLDLIEEPGRC